MTTKRTNTKVKTTSRWYEKKNSTSLTGAFLVKKKIILLQIKIAYQINIYSHPDFINHWFKLTFTICILPFKGNSNSLATYM